MAHVRVIPDNKTDIIGNIKELSSNYSLVFTSGGIGKYSLLFIFNINFNLGPAHDDITYGSISEAFNVPLVEHKPTIAKMLDFYKTTSLNAGQMRMGVVPQADHVYETPGLWVPLVKTRNVLMLPGVPVLFKRMIDNWFERELKSYVDREELSIEPRMRISIKTLWQEPDIAEKLTALQVDALKFDIALGSYPKMFQDGSSFVVISISGPLEHQNEIIKFSTDITAAFEGEIYYQ